MPPVARSSSRLRSWVGIFMFVIAIGFYTSLSPAMSSNFPRARANIRHLVGAQLTNTTTRVKNLWNRTKTATINLLGPTSTVWREGYESGFKAGYEAGMQMRGMDYEAGEADDPRDAQPLALPAPPAAASNEVSGTGGSRTDALDVRVSSSQLGTAAAAAAAASHTEAAAGLPSSAAALEVTSSSASPDKIRGVGKSTAEVTSAASATAASVASSSVENVVVDDESCVPKEKEPWPFYRIQEDEEDRPTTPVWPQVGWKWLSTEEPAFRNGMKFYIYEEDPFDIDRVTRCFLDKHKIPHNTTNYHEWDDALSLVVRLYIPELLVWPILRKHPMRTMNPEEAGLFVIGYSPLLGQMGSPCDGETDIQWEDRVAKALQESKWYKRNNGADHLIFWMKYNQKASDDLTKVLNSGSLVATTDRYFWNVYRNIPKPFKEGTVVIMPYLDSSYIDRVDTNLAKPLVKNKAARYFFRGILKRRFGKRGTLLELQSVLNGTRFLDKKMPYQPAPQMLIDNAEEIFESQMCMCPQGDAPTSGRVFEAAAAACVPIVVAPRGLMPTDMPFPSLIKWDEIAFFTDNFEQMSAKPGGLDTFAKILEGIPQERLECMQRKARRVYFERMSYFKNPLGVTEAMLFEIWVLLQKRHLLQGPYRDKEAVTGLRGDKYARRAKGRLRRFLLRRRRRRLRRRLM